MSGRGTPPREVVLVHSSDLHIDDPLIPGAYNGLDGLQSVLATAAAVGADAILLAGDTFDNARVSAAVLARAGSLLAQAGRRVVMLPGNHDPLQENCLFRRAGLRELPHIHILGPGDAGAVLFDDLGLEVHGVAHVSFNDFQPLGTARVRAAHWQVVMGHGHYVPPGEEAAEAHRAWRFDDTVLAAHGADYIALGHWDRPLRVGAEGTQAYYSGSPDLAGTVNVVRLHPDTGATVTREGLIWPEAPSRG